MRRLFFTIFLWFWLTLAGVGIVFIALVAHAGMNPHSVLRLSLHDLMLFSVAGGIFCYFISSYLTRPLNKLGEAAALIANGRLETRADPSLKKRRDEISDLARNFDRMAERIEALITAQRGLLGDVSHELRSPLSRLMVALMLARRGGPETTENLDRIGVEARKLDTLIGQLLTLTRIDSGVNRGPAAKVSLANLVQEVANDGDFEARAKGRRVIVARADACTVSGYEELLRAAIENVVRNAIRHTADGTAVEIAVEHNASGALVRVSDHGPGVPPQMLDEIFKPFHRVPDGGSDGAGLGLAIAERAVLIHGGQIRARNSENRGLVVEMFFS